MVFSIFKEEKGWDYDVVASHPNVATKVADLLNKRTSLTCKSCGKQFNENDDGLDIWMYDHDGGWDVGLDEKQWLSIHCDCGYHTSFNKLGISRVEDKDRPEINVVYGIFDNGLNKKFAIQVGDKFYRQAHGYNSRQLGKIRTYKTKKAAWLAVAKMGRDNPNVG